MHKLSNLRGSVKSEDRSIVGPNECARKKKQLMAKGAQREGLPVFGQAGTLKRRHEVVPPRMHRRGVRPRRGSH
jgi:hypothetical protein